MPVGIMFYYVDSTYGAKIIKRPPGALLEWSTKLPAEKGWYWVSTKFPYTETLHMMYVYDGGIFREVSPYDDEGKLYPLSKFHEGFITHWLGPIPEPEKPV